MKINEKSIIELKFALYDEQNELLEEDVAEILFADDNLIVPGLKKALEGKEEGYKAKVELDPEEAFGKYDEEQVFELPWEDFEGIEEISEGQIIELTDEEDEQEPSFLATIVNVDEKEKLVTVDANHPLVDQKVIFDIEVLKVREITEEDLESLA